MFDEEPQKAKAAAYTLAQSLEALSVEELASTIGRLREEIARVEAEIAARRSHKDAAEALFRRS